MPKSLRTQLDEIKSKIDAHDAWAAAFKEMMKVIEPDFEGTNEECFNRFFDRMGEQVRDEYKPPVMDGQN